MSEPDPWLKDYIDSKFEGLEKYIDTKFQPLENHECRITNLEKWKSYIMGACLIVGFVAGVVFKVV